MKTARKVTARKGAAKNAAAKKVATKPLSAKQQLETLIAKINPKGQPLFRSVRAALRKRFPSANELVYDYSHSLVIGYSPNENGIEAVVALSASADGLRLYFLNGPKIPDPRKMLLGSAKLTRFVQIESLKTLKLPDVEGFMLAAADMAKTPFNPGVHGELVIKTNSADARPKRK